MLYKQRSSSTINIYVAAIAAFHAPIAGQSVGRDLCGDSIFTRCQENESHASSYSSTLGLTNLTKGPERQPAGPRCPHLKGFTTLTSLPYSPESFLLKLAILWVHLTNIVQAPPSLGLSILYGRQVSTYGTTPRPQMTLWLNLCLVYSIDSPGSYSHGSLGFESFHVIAWHDCTCSHTSVLDAVRVKYRKGTYSVTNVTSVP